MQVRIFQPQCYVPVALLRVGYAEVIFIQPGGKLDTMWRGAGQRLATRHQGEMWPLSSHCSRTVLSLTPPETQKLAAWEPAVHFVHRIARISRRSTIIKVSPQLTKWRERLSKAWQKLPHGTIIANSSLLPPFYTRLVLFARWRHYFIRLIKINYSMMFSMKRTWFMPKLVKICSIFLKL